MVNPGFISAGLPPRSDQLVDLVRRIDAADDERDVIRSLVIASTPTIGSIAANYSGMITNDAAWHTYASQTVTVPTNCTRCTFFTTAAVTQQAATGSVITLQAEIVVTGASGPTTGGGVSSSSGGVVTAYANYPASFVGLKPGDSMKFEVGGWCSGSTQTSSSNGATIGGVLIWTAN